MSANIIEPADYRAAVEAAALFDLSGRGAVELTGKDRVGFLNNFCTNDLLKTAPGAGCEAFLTTNQARIVAWLQIIVIADHVMVTAESGLAQKIIAYLERFLISEDVQLTDRSNDLAQFLITGPRAESILRAVGASALALDAPWLHREGTIAGAAVRLIRRDWLGLPGYFLFLEQGRAREVTELLIASGATLGTPPAYEALRLEAGLPAYGPDIDESNLPQEVNRMAQAISFTKGCYVGQETVARIHALGHVNRVRVGFKLALDIDRDTPLQMAGRLLKEGGEVGKITSLAWSPVLATPLAMGYIRREHSAPATQLQVELNGSLTSAEVTPWPRTS